MAMATQADVRRIALLKGFVWVASLDDKDIFRAGQHVLEQRAVACRGP